VRLADEEHPMRVGTAAFIQSELAALQILSRASSNARSGSKSGSANDPFGDGFVGSSGAAGGASGYLASGALPDGANAIAAIKAMAQSSIFRNAAMGTADDQVRALVRDGKLAQLPALDESQWAKLSKSEQNIYGVVRTLQGMYDAQPKTIEQALSDHVKTVLDSYPDAIARMKDGLVSGALPANDGWNEMIARFEADLTAAQQGRMQIHAVTDAGLVRETGQFTVSGGEHGWSGSGESVQANIAALQSAYGTKNVLPGASPYFGAYVITW
jgi:hypothetical protein